MSRYPFASPHAPMRPRQRLHGQWGTLMTPSKAVAEEDRPPQRLADKTLLSPLRHLYAPCGRSASMRAHQAGLTSASIHWRRHAPRAFQVPLRAQPPCHSRHLVPACVSGEGRVNSCPCVCPRACCVRATQARAPGTRTPTRHAHARRHTKCVQCRTGKTVHTMVRAMQCRRVPATRFRP